MVGLGSCSSSVQVPFSMERIQKLPFRDDLEYYLVDPHRVLTCVWRVDSLTIQKRSMVCRLVAVPESVADGIVRVIDERDAKASRNRVLLYPSAAQLEAIRRDPGRVALDFTVLEKVLVIEQDVRTSVRNSAYSGLTLAGLFYLLFLRGG